MLKKISILTAFLLLMGTSSLLAQEKSESVFSSWIKSIQQKIDHILPKKTLPLSTGVAGIRGAKEEGAAKLYWKGKQGAEAVTEEELSKFKAGIDLAEKGDRQGSIKTLEEFMKQYPDSALIPDAKKTIDLAKGNGTVEKKVEAVQQKKDQIIEEKKEETKPVKKEVKKTVKKKVKKNIKTAATKTTGN
ncbi:MAG: hypothetical protein WC539_07150 [Nitrospirota bacterium]